jgi:hypothetical protein
MTEESIWKVLLATFIGVITTSPQFGVIVFILLATDAIFGFLFELSLVKNKTILIFTDKLTDAIFNFMKKMGIIYLMLISTTAFSKTDSLVVWIDVFAHIAIGFYLIGRVWRYGARILADDSFTEFVSKTLESWSKKIE